MLTLASYQEVVLQSFMPAQAPKSKQKQQSHVLVKAVFVATDGLSANIYKANTKKWKGVKEETKSENMVAVN